MEIRAANGIDDFFKKDLFSPSLSPGWAASPASPMPWRSRRRMWRFPKTCGHVSLSSRRKWPPLMAQPWLRLCWHLLSLITVGQIPQEGCQFPSLPRPPSKTSLGWKAAASREDNHLSHTGCTDHMKPFQHHFPAPLSSPFPQRKPHKPH